MKSSQIPNHLPAQIARKADRKLRARAAGSPEPWFGLGLFGMIGWSVALPAVLGALLGLWLDRAHPGRFSWTLSVALPAVLGALLGLWLDHAHPGRFSWTLSLLLGGLTLGCIAAWQWVDRMGPPHE